MNAAIARAVLALDRRIDQLDRRIQELDTYSESPPLGMDAPLTTGNLESAMETLVRLHAERLNLRARREVVWAFGKVLEATPARSGYARSGWTLNSGEVVAPPAFPAGEEGVYHADRVEAAVRKALADLPEDPLAPVIVSNAVPYMALLEAGLSDQAPAGFVAAAVENLRARLELLAHEDSP